jgi:hypothetical protein
VALVGPAIAAEGCGVGVLRRLVAVHVCGRLLLGVL